MTRPRGRAGVVCGALVLGAGLVGGCGEGAVEPPGPYWVEGVTADAVAQHLEVGLPAAATEAKAAQQRGHDDLLLLSFVLPEPVSASGVRETQVCAPCVQRDLDFLQLAVAPVDGKNSRVHLRAAD